ncbi:MAG: glycosyltransferase family A protein [Actinomycetes bacterium]
MITKSLLDSLTVEVDMRWAAIGTGEPNELLDRHTEFHVQGGDKFSILNRLIGRCDLEQYDYLVVIDDDIEFSAGWLDGLLNLQSACELDFCQPARTATSEVSHAFTLQIPGIQARETEFVEIGPVFVMSKKAFGALLPFDEAFPMGWGMESEWRSVCGREGLRMGIIDAYPIEHSFRPTLAYYDRHTTVDQMTKTLESKSFSEVFDGQRVVATYSHDTWQRHWLVESSTIEISVVITTWNRHSEARRVLHSLTQQNADAPNFEVVLVDDGSAVGYEDIVREFQNLLTITHVTKKNSGIASSRNLGLFVARGTIVLFQDDDDYLCEDFLSQLSQAHREWHGEKHVVLNATALDESLKTSYLMVHATSARGGHLFSYDSFRDKDELTPREFWGGRISVKRRFLLECGVFDSRFTWGYEDTELGERLRPHGLQVFFSKNATSYSFRQLSLRHLLKRSYQQGVALALLLRLAPSGRAGEHYGFAFDVRYSIGEVELEHLVTTAEAAIRQADELLMHDLETDEDFHHFLDELITFLHRAYFQRGSVGGVGDLLVVGGDPRDAN